MREMVQGQIIVVQEMRFRLMTDDGRGFLFTLAHGATVDTVELNRWQRGANTVCVAYCGKPGLDSCVAHAVHAI